MFLSILVNYYVLDMLSKSLLDVLLYIHLVLDFHDFVDYMLCSDIFASHSTHDRFATLSSLPQYGQQIVTVTMICSPFAITDSCIFSLVLVFYHIILRVQPTTSLMRNLLIR